MSRYLPVMCRGWDLHATAAKKPPSVAVVGLVANVVLTISGCAVTFSDWPSRDGGNGGAGAGGVSGDRAGSSAAEAEAGAGETTPGGAGGGHSRDDSGADSAGAGEPGGAGTTAGTSATAGSVSTGGEPGAGSTATGGRHTVGGASGAATGGASAAGETSATGGTTAGGTSSATGGKTSAGGNANGGTSGGGGNPTGGTTGAGGQTSGPACVRFVDRDAPSGGDGLTWATAVRSVAEATGSAAAAQPCEVWVAEGTYYVYAGSPSDSVHISNGVSVYGGFSGVETARAERDWQKHVTTLSGYSYSGSSRVYHVVTAAGSSTLDGFAITGGNASLAPDDSGGGLLAENASMVVRNCTFMGNYAVAAGGGAYVAGGTAIIEDSAFFANDAGDSGGGLQMNADGLVARCSIYENSSGNDAAGLGIAAAGPTVQNSIFYRNIASDFSGGLAVGPDSSGAQVLNNTFYDNDAPHGGGGLSLNTDVALAANNLALDNTGKYGPNILIFADRTATAHHNCANGGMDGTDNIDADPELVAPASGDFRLMPTSPCIDQGDDALAPAQDMTGGARVDIADVGVSVSDMGAFEYRP